MIEKANDVMPINFFADTPGKSDFSDPSWDPDCRCRCNRLVIIIVIVNHL